MWLTSLDCADRFSGHRVSPLPSRISNDRSHAIAVTPRHTSGGRSLNAGTVVHPRATLTSRRKSEELEQDEVEQAQA